MTVKHGNWNAHQKTEAELHKDEQEKRAASVGSAVAIARQMFDVLCDSDLTADQRAVAVDILNTLYRKLGV